MRILILLLSSLSLSSAAQNANEIMNKMLERMKEHKSISYTARYELSSNMNGKQNVSGLVHLYRNEQDEALGGLAWLSEGIKYETYSFYDGKKRYIVLNPIRKAWMEKMPGTNAMGLSQLSDKLLDVPFLRSKFWETSFKEATLKKGNDTNINGKDCYAIQRETQYGGGQPANIETYCINKADHFPILITRLEHKGEKTEYSSLELSNYQFDKVGTEQFAMSQIPSGYTIESRDRELPKGVQPQVRPAEDWPVRRR
jgi:hypothetical protein